MEVLLRMQIIGRLTGKPSPKSEVSWDIKEGQVAIEEEMRARHARATVVMQSFCGYMGDASNWRLLWLQSREQGGASCATSFSSHLQILAHTSCPSFLKVCLWAHLLYPILSWFLVSSISHIDEVFGTLPQFLDFLSSSDFGSPPLLSHLLSHYLRNLILLHSVRYTLP